MLLLSGDCLNRMRRVCCSSAIFGPLQAGEESGNLQFFLVSSFLDILAEAHRAQWVMISIISSASSRLWQTSCFFSHLLFFFSFLPSSLPSPKFIMCVSCSRRPEPAKVYRKSEEENNDDLGLYNDGGVDRSSVDRWCRGQGRGADWILASNAEKKRKIPSSTWKTHNTPYIVRVCACSQRRRRLLSRYTRLPCIHRSPVAVQLYNKSLLLISSILDGLIQKSQFQWAQTGASSKFRSSTIVSCDGRTKKKQRTCWISLDPIPSCSSAVWCPPPPI